nr:UDP-N-acetylmuramoyl-L-alanyl-D-glutamate--2,6-diaminopimelate ligase [Methylocapsa palsarum]
MDIPEAFAAREVESVTCDSRAVAEGGVFFAVPGTKADGLDFAAQAVDSGAFAIVAERDLDPPLERALLIKVADVRGAMARAAAAMYPRQPGTIAAVTGTSGKTSVAAFVRQIWAALGLKAASIGTLGVVAPSASVYGSLTTPDPVSLHKTLDQLARDGITHLALEASSHGIVQRRLDGVRLMAGAFTNLSRDHLDYHGTMEAYLAAKLELFDRLLEPGAAAVVDADSDAAPAVVSACETRGLRVLTTGAKGASLRLAGARANDFGTDLRIAYEGHVYAPRLPLAGAFQVSNALVAAGLCIALGGPAAAVFGALERLKGAPGRLELAGRRNGAPVFVDYAHKPDALDNVLRTLRPYVSRRLIVVFGCGGDRDAGKRPMMGEIAARLADLVIVTDDNPRTEDPAVIRRAILVGAGESPKIREIADRANAIATAVGMLEPGDGLVIAGKGHETGQIVGSETLPFSDFDCALAALKDEAA